MKCFDDICIFCVRVTGLTIQGLVLRGLGTIDRGGVTIDTFRHEAGVPVEIIIRAKCPGLHCQPGHVLTQQFGVEES